MVGALCHVVLQDAAEDEIFKLTTLDGQLAVKTETVSVTPGGGRAWEWLGRPGTRAGQRPRQAAGMVLHATISSTAVVSRGQPWSAAGSLSRRNPPKPPACPAAIFLHSPNPASLHDA